MRPILVLPIVAALALTACAAPTWRKPFANEADFARDKADCEYESVKYSGGYDSSMRSASGQGIGMGLRRLEIMRACMRNKGWVDSNA